MISDTLTLNSNLLTERQRAVIETMRMRLTEEQSLTYLKEVGFQCSHATLYREKNKVEKLKLKRLYHITQIGFQDQHLERIDIYEMGFKMMWQNILLEKDPYKRNVMIKDILLLQPYLSSYYEATKLIVQNQQGQQGQQQEGQYQNHESELVDDDDDDYDEKNDIIINNNSNTKF